MVHVKHAAHGVGGIRILIKRLLEGFLRFGILVLCHPQIAQLHIRGRIIGLLLQGPLKILIRRCEPLLTDFGHPAQQVSVRSCRLYRDDLVRFLRECPGIIPVDGSPRQRSVRVRQVRTQSNRIAPLCLCPAGVAQLVECQSELVMRRCVIGIAFQHAL